MLDRVEAYAECDRDDDSREDEDDCLRAEGDVCPELPERHVCLTRDPLLPGCRHEEAEAHERDYSVQLVPEYRHVLPEEVQLGGREGVS